METINDIVREMRDLGRLDEKSTDKIPRSLQALGLRTYADRIEAATKNGLNVAAMCEALKMFVDAYKTTSYTLCLENLRPAFQKAEAALTAPPRNCDLYTGRCENENESIAKWNEMTKGDNR